MWVSNLSNFYRRSLGYIRRQIRDFKRRPVRSYERSLIKRNWYDLSARSELPLVLIGGCGRSGTTLLREMLNRHSRLFCGPETSMFGLPFWPNNISKMWNLDEKTLISMAQKAENLVNFAEEFYIQQSNKAGKKRPADKTPNNIRVIGKLLTWFPNGRFIHLIRDGRDVACSLRNHPKEKIENGKIVPSLINRSITDCAQRWLNDTSNGLVYRNHPRYHEIKYEDLVTDPEAVLIKLCEFLREDYQPSMVDPKASQSDNMDVGRLVNNQNSKEKISSRSLGRWRNDLTADEKKDFEDVAGELLIALGYVDSNQWLKK
jgi:protein-tyrosine sulfotransferase